MTPAEELRKAAENQRDGCAEYVGIVEASPAVAFHVALADLLEHIADDMDDENAVEHTHSLPVNNPFVGVHSSDGFGDLGAMRSDWTAALDVARAINGGAE